MGRPEADVRPALLGRLFVMAKKLIRVRETSIKIIPFVMPGRKEVVPVKTAIVVIKAVRIAKGSIARQGLLNKAAVLGPLARTQEIAAGLANQGVFDFIPTERWGFLLFFYGKNRA